MHTGGEHKWTRSLSSVDQALLGGQSNHSWGMTKNKRQVRLVLGQYLGRALINTNVACTARWTTEASVVLLETLQMHSTTGLDRSA